MKEAAEEAQRVAQEEAALQSQKEGSAEEALRRAHARVARAPTMASKHLRFGLAGQEPVSFAAAPVRPQAAYMRQAVEALPAHVVQAPRPAREVFPPDFMGPRWVRSEPF